ncbi:MAG: hypothetical protein JWM11_262, partial [Planctomycetaceae bacterium]|nr:hypothetical protein [Planctomycetaceae bacterium]
MSRRKKTQTLNQSSPQTAPQTTELPVAGASTSRRFRIPQFKIPRLSRLQTVVTCAIVGLLVVVVFLNRGGKGNSARVEEARKMLQINRPRMAIEALAKEDSAEGHYLKSIALQAVGQSKAAREQISEAIGMAPSETKYQGYNLVLQLGDGKSDAVNELIKLYAVSKSSPGIAFFATRAFTQRKPPEIRNAIQAFELGMTLIDDTPEFMFSALHFAVDGLQQAPNPGEEELRKQKIVIAERLLEKLERVAPKDPDLIKELLNWAIRGKLADSAQHLLQRFTELKADSPEIIELRVLVELMLGKASAAIIAAQQAVSEHPGDPAMELMLAEAVWQAPPSAENEKILTDLIAKHPENPEYVAKLALYLAKSKRVGDAVAVVNQALAVTKGGEQRGALLRLAVGIPLEANNAVLAEQQVNRYKPEFNNPKIVEYFEGRVLFLKQDFPAAKQRFQKVLENQQINRDADRMLAAECLIWYQRILKWELVNAKRAAAAEALKTPATSKNKGSG